MNKKIVWEVFKEMPDFSGVVVFDVRAKVRNIKVEKQFILGYKGSFTAPIGLVAGFLGKPGFYASARINPKYFKKISLETNGVDPPEGWFIVPNEVETQRLSITAGIQQQLNTKWHINAGIGFAKYNLLWQIGEINAPSNTQWTKNTAKSFNSFDVEAGLLFRSNHLFCSAGFSVYKKYSDIIFSVGYAF